MDYLGDSTYFFFVFAGTILITRVFLSLNKFLSPRKLFSPNIGDLNVHHYMYGLVLVLVSILFSNLTLYAIGLGLFIDELPQLLRGKMIDDWNVYFAKSFLLGVVICILAVYLFRDFIVSVVL